MVADIVCACQPSLSLCISPVYPHKYTRTYRFYLSVLFLFDITHVYTNTYCVALFTAHFQYQLYTYVRTYYIIFFLSLLFRFCFNFFLFRFISIWIVQCCFVVYETTTKKQERKENEITTITAEEQVNAHWIAKYSDSTKSKQNQTK